jgi:hypothetical protein
MPVTKVSCEPNIPPVVKDPANWRRHAKATRAPAYQIGSSIGLTPPARWSRAVG